MKRCADAYADNTGKLLFYFLQYALSRLNKFNTLFQSESCRILELEKETCDLLRVYLMNFIKPDLMSMATDVTKVDYKSPSNYKCFEEISIGQQTTRYITFIEMSVIQPPYCTFMKVL